MKKIIINKDNYEELMFDLIEDKFDKEVSSNLIDQIEADTFLNFEWQQWQKTRFSESLSEYKNDEAEFIESLTKEEEMKKGLVFRWIPYAVAASILLLLGFYFLNRDLTDATQTTNQIVNIQTEKKGDQLPALSQDSSLNVIANELPKRKTVVPQMHPKRRSILPDTLENKLENRKELKVVELNKVQTKNALQDTVDQMIAAAMKKPRYKITIIEGPADAINLNTEDFIEKRYTMLDVLNKKDGISLSKFLQNSNSRIVTDPISKKTSIEYVAADHSVLVLTLSN